MDRKEAQSMSEQEQITELKVIRVGALVRIDLPGMDFDGRVVKVWRQGGKPCVKVLAPNGAEYDVAASRVEII